MKNEGFKIVGFGKVSKPSKRRLAELGHDPEAEFHDHKTPRLCECGGDEAWFEAWAEALADAEVDEVEGRP